MFDFAGSGRSSLVLYLLITVLVIALFVDGNQTLQRLELKVQDSMFRFRPERTPSGQVVICALDETAATRMGWPMQRDSLARLLYDLRQAGAAVVVCDFDWRHVAPVQSLAADSVFWPALSTVVDNVILPLHFTYADLGVSVPAVPASYRLSTWTEHFPAGSAVSAQAYSGPEGHLADSATAVASITPMLEPDRVVRYCPLLIDYGGSPFASNALWAASLYQDVGRARWWLEPGSSVKIADREIPTDEHGRLLLNFAGPPKSFRYFSAADVLDGKPGLSLEHKIVVVSPTCLAGSVMLTTRIANDFPASEVTATAIENIITGNFVHKPSYSALFDLLVMALIGLFAGMVLPKVSLTYRFVILGATLFVIVNLQYLIFASFGWLTQAFYPEVLVVCFMVLTPLVKSREEREQREQQFKVRRQRSGPVPTKVAAQPTGPTYPAHPASAAAEPTSYSDSDATRRARDTDQAPMVGQPAPAQAPTMRVDASLDPTRQVSPPSSDAITRLVQAGPSGAVSPDSESLFLEEAPATEAPAVQTRRTEAAPAERAVEGGQGSGAIRLGPTGEAGQNLGRYQIIEEIGRGAMGVVYRGIDPAINRPVALKTVRLDLAVPPAEKEELRARLMREAQAAGQLSHPNIVTIYDVGSQGDVYYIAMEYLKGYTLERAVEKKLTLNYKIFAKLMIQVCDALEYAHSNELVHRDVKPANIMVLDNFRVKVMDFGIARVTNSSMTQTGVALGTPSYISPEQLSGHGVDRRSDIFSVGVVMYELLTKDKPFSGESISKLIYNILNSAPRRPTQMDPNIPEAFDRICLKALEKDPRQRYQYAADLARDLKEFIASLQPRRMVI